MTSQECYKDIHRAVAIVPTRTAVTIFSTCSFIILGLLNGPLSSLVAKNVVAHRRSCELNVLGILIELIGFAISVKRSRRIYLNRSQRSFSNTKEDQGCNEGKGQPKIVLVSRIRLRRERVHSK